MAREVTITISLSDEAEEEVRNIKDADDANISATTYNILRDLLHQTVEGVKGELQKINEGKPNE